MQPKYVLSVLLVLAGLATLMAAPARASQTLDRIVAVVDDDIIMESELVERVATVRVRMREQNTPMPPEEALKQQVLERMIVESIELQMAERSGIRVDDNRINDTLENIARQNNMTTEQFRRTVVDEGISWRGLRDQIKRELVVGQLRQRKVGGRIQITDQDVDNFLNSEVGKTNLAPDYRLGHILIPTSTDGDLAATEEKALQVYRELQSGTDFSQLAAQYSAGEQALQGGDLGWRKAAQLPELFATSAETLQVNEVAGPFRTPGGLHLIKLLARRGADNIKVPQWQARHILIKPNEILSTEDARQKLEDIRARLLQGASFADLARTYSDDPGSARQGGDLGWVTQGDMVPEFDAMMRKTPVDSVSDVFQTPYGWHLLTVTGSREQDMSERYRSNMARQALYTREYDDELASWLRELRNDAFVEVRSN